MACESPDGGVAAEVAVEADVEVEGVVVGRAVPSSGVHRGARTADGVGA